MSDFRSSDSANGPTIRRLRGQVLDVSAEHWWHRSSRCSGGDCVCVARQGSIVLVWDSKNPGVYQAWTPDEWRALLRLIKWEWTPDGVSRLADGCVEFGLERHDKLTFTGDEWKAFCEGVIAEEFEIDKLREFRSSSSRRGVAEEEREGSDSAAGPDQAATGAGGTSILPAPVAAHEPLADAASTPGAASADGSGLRPSPATGAGEAGAASSRPAPVAAPTLGWISVAAIDAVEAVALELCAAWPIEIGSDLVFADQVARIAAKAVWPFAYQAGWSDHGEWAKRAAPLVPAVETQETVS